MMVEELQRPPPAYFAVGPKPHEVTCPFCKAIETTVVRKSLLSCCCSCSNTRRQYCGACVEYLGRYRRPQL